MNCPRCQTPLADDARFCSACGAPGGGSDEAGVDSPTQTSLGSAAGVADASSISGDDPIRFLPGTILGGRYRVVGPVGRGGMGEVYRADDMKLGRAVALKFLPEGLERNADRLQRFLMEARVALNVTHPNVCRVHDIGEIEGHHYISMEFVDGEDLGSLLRRIGRLPADKALEVARQLCAGLAAAHDQGVVHRDLKPANVMIDGRGRVRITDFGLAALTERVGGAEARSGTPDYMAPEQLEGREATARSDLFALGLVLYEVFTGKKPFPAGAGRRTHRDSSTSVSSLASHVDGLDPAIERAIFHCLEEDPADRPGSALVVAAALPGGDPLAAALAAGELPSPELIAASAQSNASSPIRAYGLAALALVLFVTAATLGGRYMVRAYVPLERPPAAMEVGAREMIERLGYTEPVHADPYDRAAGYNVWNGPRRRILENDDSADRWERLRDPEARIVTYWYRQGPSLMSPRPTQWGTFAGGPVSRWNPFPSVTGQILVSLDAAGRLAFFVYTPRRYIDGEIPGPEPDWSTAFELAGLSIDEFERVEPRYQRFMAPEWRAAWTRTQDVLGKASTTRVEAGGQDGRIVLFGIMNQDDVESLAEAPTESEGWNIDWLMFLVPITIFIVASVFVARWNLRTGRGDWQGAKRLGGFVFVLTFVWHLLDSHGIFGHGDLGGLYPITATALFYLAATTSLYLAVEPLARRIWPSVLGAWSRALGRTKDPWHDAAIGRSVLWGILAGSAVSLVGPLRHFASSILEGAPPAPVSGAWSILLGQRHTLASIADIVSSSITQALMIAFILVVMRLLLRRVWLAILAGGVILVLLGGDSFSLTIEGGLDLAVNILVNACYVAVLLRFGVLGAAATILAFDINFIARTVDWSAWHAQPSWTVVALLALLLLAAARAASSGHQGSRSRVLD